MATFSSRERLIASLLSSFPLLKKFIKSIYIRINAVVYKKSYTYKILCDKIDSINMVSNDNQETFFGYYDKFSINRVGLILSQATNRQTHLKPSAHIPIQLLVKDISNRDVIKIGETFAYTWQQGARCQWISNDKIIYNIFQDNQYKAVVYSLLEKGIVKCFDYPVQEVHGTDYFLSINYRRIMYLRPDYGYRNLPLPTLEEMKDLTHDGIWMVEYDTAESILLHSLQEIVQCEFRDIFSSCLHKVNHIMMNKSGSGFIFIHRYYHGKRRFDRLFYSDFKSLKVLVDDGMVSHCCWIDDHTVFGYFRYAGKDGFYYCDVLSGKITPCATITNLKLGDGHPSCHGDWIVFDSYPDKSRMQHLFLYNRKSDKIIPLLELYHSVRYSGESRCDLHPRFSADGKYISFDTVYTGKRTQCYIDISKLL